MKPLLLAGIVLQTCHVVLTLAFLMQLKKNPEKQANKKTQTISPPPKTQSILNTNLDSALYLPKPGV